MTWRRGASLTLVALLVGFSALACQATRPAEIGMLLHYRGDDAATIARQFDLMADMGVRWVRFDIEWSLIQSEPGTFDWTSTDTIVDEARAHGMNPLAVLAFTPGWAVTAQGLAESDARHARPDQLSDYATFARIAAERYAPRGVRSWEIWNEPNLGLFWPPRPDADEYATLFRAAATAIRNVDPNATLVTGGLSPRYPEPDVGVSPLDYLQQLYENGTAQLADAIAVHPYSFPVLPDDENEETIGEFKDLPALHEVMERNGDGAKKLWITEFGAPTGNGPNAVSEDDQALALLQARQQVEKWDWVGPLIYYELVDGGSDRSVDGENFGVLRHDLDPKPAAVALMQAASGDQE
ncbi:cellulase family glycosylhydrolase [Mycolicibacterium sp. S2-37]|uniref:cellulase family glycosylhydrolase n=1 Tax=Mycolicibacterium sp. S2-37 TaxID=2810297 RepID=UPI001A94128C|nr:cellulase family glycosylhydrolase [Mycolicibacterium sp. S2-37]MBO0681408.1 cellulase family glycosylhydrolase [Mycolicibacterium sp. S2-37]